MAVVWKRILTTDDLLSAGGSQQLSHGRLTLESGVPVSSADQTAKTTLYFTPYVGNIISLYSDTAWEDKTFTEIHIDLTETQSCTTVNGDATLTVADTSQLIVGMEVSGTGIAGGTTIVSITDATHLEMSANATADATNNIAFKIPASKVVDVFAYNAAGSAKLVFGPLWTDATTRATAITTKDGVPVLTGTYAISGTDYTEGKLKHIGTIATTATAGQIEDSYGGGTTVSPKRLVSNKYNAVYRDMFVEEDTASTYQSTTIRQLRGAADNQIEFVHCEARTVDALAACFFAHSPGVNMGMVGIGIDRTDGYDGNYGSYGAVGITYGGMSVGITRMVAAGYHYLSLNQSTANTAAAISFCDTAVSGIPTSIDGLKGKVLV